MRGAVRRGLLGAMLLLSAPLALVAEESADEAPITDNSFFVEEAYNQEPGVVQHIFTLNPFRDTDGRRDAEGTDFSWTDEWPLSGMAHQFSFTVPLSSAEETPRGGKKSSSSGVGDILLNYRYQLRLDDEKGPAIAPRISLILPTGDEDEGLGDGVTGIQLNLPVSKLAGDFAYHLNGGLTYLPGVASGKVGDVDLTSYNLAFSLIHHTTGTLNLLAELPVSIAQEADGRGGKGESVTALFVPGARYAINSKSGAQYVLGAGLPLGLTEGSPDWGLFLYLSIEYPF